MEFIVSSTEYEVKKETVTISLYNKEFDQRFWVKFPIVCNYKQGDVLKFELVK